LPSVLGPSSSAEFLPSFSPARLREESRDSKTPVIGVFSGFLRVIF
jgi:hypothetical protein